MKQTFIEFLTEKKKEKLTVVKRQKFKITLQRNTYTLGVFTMSNGSVRVSMSNEPGVAMALSNVMFNQSGGWKEQADGLRNPIIDAVKNNKPVLNVIIKATKLKGWKKVK